jgi:hypothetical protein
MRSQVSHHIHRAALERVKRFPLADDAARDLLTQIRDSRTLSPHLVRRTSPRFEVGGRPASLSVVHPGGSIAAAECLLMDISGGGAALLYPGFLHEGSECVLHAVNLEGESVMIPARVVWCRFVGRSIHTIGLEWEEPIDPRIFVPSKDWLEQMSQSGAQVKTEISGRMLAVGVGEIESELLRMYLAETSLELVFAGFSGAALDEVRRQAFDIMLVDGEGGEQESRDLVARLRGEGFREPILVVQEVRGGVEPQFEKGTLLLPKPYDRDGLLAVTRDLLLANENPLTGSRPIRSELPDLQSKAAAVSAYVQRVREFAERLESAIAADRADEALQVLQSVRNTASGFGFPMLVEAVSQAITAVNACGSAEEASSSIRTVERMLNRLEDPVDQVRA